MKKQLHFSRATKNAFLIPLLVATLLILGVVVYATLGGTEIRSKAANYAKCMLPTKSGVNGRATCKSGYSLNNNLCCPLVQVTPCTPRPACLDADSPCRIKLAAGSAPFCPKPSPACSKDAKKCPDGTVLQRTGPNCEFISCPKPAQTPTPTSIRRPTPYPTTRIGR